MYSMPSAQNLQTLRRRKKTFLRMSVLPSGIEAARLGIEAAGLAVGTARLVEAARLAVGAPRFRIRAAHLVEAAGAGARGGHPHRLSGERRPLPLAQGAAQVLVGADRQVAEHPLVLVVAA